VPHLFTHSLDDQSESLELQLEKKREREADYLREEFLYCLVYSLGIELAIYIKEVFDGFLLANSVNRQRTQCLSLMATVKMTGKQANRRQVQRGE
jgi:hypothetical protein